MNLFFPEKSSRIEKTTHQTVFLQKMQLTKTLKSYDLQVEHWPTKPWLEKFSR